MSESRNSGESRTTYVATHNSESRSEESRFVRTGGSNVFKPVVGPRQTIMGNSQNNTCKYNNLDSIDELIERLESSIPETRSISDKINAAYDERRRKIAELKNLQKQAREEQERQKKVEEAEKELAQINAGNEELDQAINQIKQMVKKPAPTYYHSSCSWDDGESHSSESRW